MILLLLHETEGSATIPNHVDGSRNHLDSLLELGNQVEIFESGIIISKFTFGCLVFLNQPRAGLRPACTWFLKIEPVRIICMYVCVCVCPPPRLLITSGVMWRDIDSIRLVKQVL